MKDKTPPTVFKSISAYMRSMGMPKPVHPLVALVKYESDKVSRANAGRTFLVDFYKVSFKEDFTGQVKYGQGYYDFEEGGLAFIGPNQLITMSTDESCYEDGYNLYFHADLIRSYQLARNIDQYGFFAYAVNEALFVSAKEKKILIGLFENIGAELDNNTDHFSQDVLVSQIELLLNYSNRFYNRQFLTRKAVHSDLINSMNKYLTARFDQSGSIPTVQEVATQLSVSPRYLTDMLKSLTGQSAQQHIHDRLIEMAKVVLSTTRLTVAEIAYQLGFEHPQSFNKLFKRATSLSPNAFRKSFNHN
jgi:AraC-like DNA-binding protein